MKNSQNGSAKNKVVVITGASSGVGRACARAFAQKGYDVGLIARGIDGLKGAKEEVEALGRRAEYCQVDVAIASDLENAADELEQKLGVIDVWVNNAVNSVFSPIKDMLADEFKRVTEVTYLGQVYGALVALKKMTARNRGSIVFVGSALAQRGIPLQSAYCAAQHAIQGFYESLRAELTHDKSDVKLSMVELPAINTPQYEYAKNRLSHKPKPMGPVYQPEVAADAIVYAAEHNRREMYVGFSSLKAILGNKIAPWYADHVMATSGYEEQISNIPADPNRPDNLWAPVPGDHGCHGKYNEQAYEKSEQVWLSKNRGLILGGLLAAGAIMLFK